MTNRELASYIAELIGTAILVFAVGLVVTLFVAASPEAATGSDFAVVGLVHGFVLFFLIMLFGAVSGGHFNPAVTLAAMTLRRIDWVDGAVYMLAQLSGAVLGALLVKGFLLDAGRAGNYGAVEINDGLLAGSFLSGSLGGAALEAIGAMALVLAVLAVAMNPRARNEWAPLTIGLTLGLVVMIIGPLTGAAVNPARWFGPALIGDAFNGFANIWPYVLGPVVGALAAAGVYKLVIEPPEGSRRQETPPPGGTGTEGKPPPPPPPAGRA